MLSCSQNFTKSDQKDTKNIPSDPLALLDQNQRQKNTVEVWSRSFMVLPEHIGKDVKIYNGKNWVFRKVVEEMVGHKYGEFYFTKKKTIHKINKVKQVTRKK